MKNSLEWLQEWFLSQCNGDWEHCFTIKMITLNQGWRVVINLEETECEGKFFSTQEMDFKDGINWYQCSLKNKSFEAACGPLYLTKVLEIFREWAEECKEQEYKLQDGNFAE